MEKKRAIVSGGGRGIGAGISVKLAEEGYDLAISYANRPDCAEETARQIRERFGRECHVMRAVFEEEGAAECFVHESIDKLGGVDLLVNNAIRPGLGGSILDIDTGEMDMLMRADLRAAILCTREAARYMAKHEVRGNIIMISSMRAERAMPNAGLYSGFKAGINQMTKCFCLDLAPFWHPGQFCGAWSNCGSYKGGIAGIRNACMKWQTQRRRCGENSAGKKKEMPRILLRQWHFWHQKKHPTLPEQLCWWMAG